MSVAETSHRFLRPTDLGRTRRNHRRLQAWRVLAVFANIVLASLLALGGFWLYRQTQEDVRFAVKRIEITGVAHCPRAEVERVAKVYRGANLFRLDIEQVRVAFAGLPWVQRVAIEKRLPDTLTVRVFERKPVALFARGGAFHYVDGEGVVFAELSPAVGNPELPLIAGGDSGQIGGCVGFLAALMRTDAALYGRLSEIAPVDGGGFRVYDRSLRTYVILDVSAGQQKWRMLHGLVAAEGIAPGALEYADLRFHERIVLKPRVTGALQPASLNAAIVPALSAAIASSRD
jgi:hypothetical protein